MSKSTEELVVVDPKHFTIDHIEIHERWQTIDGIVYYEWKRRDDKKWHRVKTAYKDNPWVMRILLTPHEYERKLSKTVDLNNQTKEKL